MSQFKEQYKNAASFLAIAICRDAVWQDDCCNWIGSSSEDHYGMPKGFAKALGTNFYDGTAGIAWFLLHVSLINPNPVIKKTTEGALNQIIQTEINKKQTGDALMGKLGFHTGWTGMAYVLLYAGEALKKPAYTKAAAKLIEKIIVLPKEHWGLDVIDGAAGSIPALINLYRKQPSAALQQFIISIGDYLIEKADKQPGGWSWNTIQDKVHNLTGYGHGAAGFAAGFAELFAFTNDDKYLQIAKAVTQYEDSHFNAPQQNWPDFRNFNTGQQTDINPEPVCSIAWCHGAPGIGMARLRMLELTNDPFFKPGAETAVATTLKNLGAYMLGNYSMCHGIFGNAELLLYAAKVLNQPQLIAAAETAANDCIRDYISKKIPIPNGLQSGHETPDFMLGSSGIGYFFLRLAEPDKVRGMLLIR